MLEVPVLIVGGGPVGLTASALLSRHGVPSLLVERHPGTSIHPKARGINPRTMEIYRQCGVDDAVRAAGLPPDKAQFIIWARSLAGEELERRVPGRARAASASLTPARHCLCAQDDLEPVLRRFAEGLGPGRLRFRAELASFVDDDHGITATVSGPEGQTKVRARYVIAADGARSRVREALGVAMHGVAALYRSVNVLMHADLTPWVAHRPAALYFIEQPGLRATFLTINGANRWGFLINLPIEASVEEYTPERCAEVIRQSAGVPDLPVEILGVDPWVAAAQVASTYRRGHVFLAGDAAHHMPPTGGFGLNTGVGDVHNLAWKLAAVFHGWAGPDLLDTYEAERLPYGRAITEQSLANSLSMGRGTAPGANAGDGAAGRARPEFLNEIGMVFGARYESAAVVPDGTPPPEVPNPVTDYVPVARPGHRAPHVWLERNGQTVSTLDLFDGGFTLLAGSAGGRWRDAALRLARRSGVPLSAYTVGAAGDLGDPDAAWSAVYGLDADGAVLVRPDGHVAFRSRGASVDVPRQLDDMLRAVLADSTA